MWYIQVVSASWTSLLDDEVDVNSAMTTIYKGF